MFDPVQRSTPYFQQPKMRVWNKAFQSLSFRGKRGYPVSFSKPPPKPNTNTTKHKTYGAILTVKDEKGTPLYALVQGSYTGKWSFPKGHANEGEEPFECTLREVGEETGIDDLPEPTEYIQVGYGNYFIFKLTEQVALIPRDTHEIMDTKWVSLEEMERMPLNADASLYRKQLQAA